MPKYQDEVFVVAEEETEAEKVDANNFWSQFSDATRILDEAQFTRHDVMEITHLSEAQLKNTLDRDLVQLRSDHNPGSGRRRMFTGADILKISVAHTMSAIGFPMKWSYLVANDIENRAMNRLLGVAVEKGFGFITYPMSNGDWARIPVYEGMEAPTTPVAFQYVEVDRLIDEILAKLNALVEEEPVPDFSVPDIVPEPSPYSPENDFFCAWTKDEHGRNVRRGLTFEETANYEEHLGSQLSGDIENADQEQFLKLWRRHEATRMQYLSESFEERMAEAAKKGA